MSIIARKPMARSSAAAKRFYDDRGRIYQTIIFGVDPDLRIGYFPPPLNRIRRFDALVDS